MTDPNSLTSPLEIGGFLWGRALVALALVATLAGCGGSGQDKPTQPQAKVQTSTKGPSWAGETPDGFWHGRVDGVECIAIVNSATYNSGFNGVSCNWKDAHP